jgi:hypothetical protein
MAVPPAARIVARSFLTRLIASAGVNVVARERRGSVELLRWATNARDDFDDVVTVASAHTTGREVLPTDREASK